VNRKFLIWLLPTVFLTNLSFAQPQPAKIPRIGYLSSGSPSTNPDFREAFRQGLRDLGYVEGKNIMIEYRWAEGKFDRVPELATELVRLKVDVILAPNSAIARAAKKATTTIPIVMVNAGNLDGLVISLARPGGNITGLTNVSSDLGGKRLELLKEILPRLDRVAVLITELESQALKEIKAAAPSLQIQLQILEVRVANDLERAFAAATKERAGALAVVSGGSGLLLRNRKQIAELAVKNRLPTIFPQISYMSAGGLMSYSANEIDMYRRAATYVDKILKGRKPADLPVEQPMKFEFVINLKTAKQIGLTIPPNVLARADRVIR
jgi:putative ABC transport system substrate-binding protein